MGTRVQQVVFTSLLCMLVVTALLVRQTGATAQTTVQPQTKTLVSVPVGEYVAVLVGVAYPSLPPIIGFYSYEPVYHDVTWSFNGSIGGGSINVLFLDNSNYQLFNSSQQYSIIEQLLNVSGAFILQVVITMNTSAGIWWLVFDNRAGSSNATVQFDSSVPPPIEWVPRLNSGALILAASAVAVLVALVTHTELVRRRQRIVEQEVKRRGSSGKRAGICL